MHHAAASGQLCVDNAWVILFFAESNYVLLPSAVSRSLVSSVYLCQTGWFVCILCWGGTCGCRLLCSSTSPCSYIQQTWVSFEVNGTTLSQLHAYLPWSF
jgi:hypothetical protein